MDDASRADRPEGSGPAVTPEEWARITELFGRALDVEPGRRHAFVTGAAAGNPALAAELQSLLEAHEQPGEFLPDLPPLSPPVPDVAGRLAGAYRLTRVLGSGGMGVVYLGERSDGAFSKQVAIKLLSAAFIEARERFHRERELLARLDHPNVARLLDAGATPDGLPYLVMEYVEGTPIDRYCTDRALAFDARVRLLMEVCAGVAHAHRNLVVHCDIKPENILVTRDGAVKLLDFGIARLLDPRRRITLFRPATPAYSSPEQLQGDTVTTATDVYSIGVLAYVLLAGHGPYLWKSGRLEEVMQSVLTAEPLRASDVPGVPTAAARRLRGDLDNVLAKAVAKDPRRRYDTVQQLADDLAAYLDGYPVRARADSWMYRLRKSAGRHRLASGAVAAAAIGLLAAAVISVRQARVAQQRFEDLRAFAHAVVFDVDDALSPIPGTTAPRKLLVETALRYLDRVNQDGASDPALREELGAAYIKVGKVQGGAFLPNLGDSAGAVASFRKAIATTGPQGQTPALERLRIEAHINIARLAADPLGARPEFGAAIEAAERQLAGNPDDVATLRLIADAYQGAATMAHLANDVPANEALSGRQVTVRRRICELGAGAARDDADLARAIAQVAISAEMRGDYDAALARLREARGILEAALGREPHNQMLVRNLAENRSRTGPVLLARGRAEAAVGEIQAAVALLEPLVALDRHNAQYEADLSYAWLRLGDVRRAQRRPAEALALHRRALAVRRERAARNAGYMFVPWELTRSLNAVGELLLEAEPAQPDQAAAHFAEAIDVGERALARAPSHQQVRRQVAIAFEGLARVAGARGGGAADSRRHLERSLRAWQELAAGGSAPAGDIQRLERVRTLIASQPRE